MTIVYRKNLNRPMSWEELDGNFEEVERIGVQSQQYANNASTSAAASAASASFAQQQVIVASGEADRAKSEADRAATIAAETNGGIGGQHRKRVVNVSGVGYQGAITADALIVESSSGGVTTIRNVSLSFDGATTGANGLDVGSVLPGNWYRIFVIYDSVTKAAASILSLSESSPSLPVGYDHISKVGTAYAPAGATKFKPSRKTGNRVDLLQDGSSEFSNVLLNNVTAASITAFSCATCVPPEATHLEGVNIPSLNSYIYIYPSNNTYDSGRTLTAASGAGLEVKAMYPLLTPQTLYYSALNSSFRCTGYIED